MSSTPSPSPKETAKAALEKLTPQRRKFVLAYCETFNATKAALAAGYSKKTARTQGSHLLTLVDIKAGIRAVMNQAGMDPEEIAARWDRIARADLSDFYTKVKIEHRPRIVKRLVDVVEDYRIEVTFEQELAIRSETLITDRRERETFRKRQKTEQRKRELKLLRLEMELEQEPNATRIVTGPAVLREELQLDLMKAEELGVLDLVKSITSGRAGTSFTLRDPDAATDNLAKWRGMVTTKVDVTSGGLPVAQPAVLGVLTLEQKKQILDAKRKAQEGQANA